MPNRRREHWRRDRVCVLKRLPTKPPIISVMNGNVNITANEPTQKTTKSPPEITPIKSVKTEIITPQISEALNERFDIATNDQ